MRRIRWSKVLVFLLCLAPLFRLAWRVWNQDVTAQSHGVHPALHRRLGHPPDRRHFGRDSAAKAARRAGPHPFPPHDRALRVLLRLPARSHVPMAGQALRFSGHAEGRRRRPFITAGFAAFCVSGSAGRDFHRRVDSPPGRQALAEVAQPHLRHGDRRGGALLLVGQIRYSPADAVRNPGGPSAGLARGLPGDPHGALPRA